jgi:toxin ParE1/3/4
MATGKFVVRLTLDARADIDGIYEYLFEHASETLAEAFLEAVLDRIATLEQFPMRGNIPVELKELGPSEFRQLLFRPYRLFYHIAGRTIFVVAIADGRRDMRSFLEKRLLGS